jgi:spermidine synthase
MQALAQGQGHHFAYVVISLALLGFGSSGTVLALARDKLLQNAGRVMPLCLFLAAVSCLLALPQALSAAAQTDFPLLFVDVYSWGPLLISAALVFLPFFTAALFLGLIFMRDAEWIGRRYAANLLGSAAGAGLGLGLLLFFTPAQGFALCAAGFALAGWLLQRSWPGAILIACALAGIVLIADIKPSAYKAISYALQLPQAAITSDNPHPMGRIQIVESPALRYAPGLSLQFRGAVPDAPHLYRNGDAYGVLLRDGALLDASVQALPLALTNPAHALVLNAGSGAALAHLLAQDDVLIDAIEAHPVVADILREHYRDPRLNIITREGRAFLSTAPRRYDLIILPPQGAFGGGVGLQALQEDYLLTRESFRALWAALDTDGLLSFSVYLDQPPRQSLKLLALAAETLRDAGLSDLSSHVAAIRSWDMLAVVVSRQPLHSHARAKLSAFSQDKGFDRLWSPGEGPNVTDDFHRMEEGRLSAGFAALLSADGAPAFYKDYLFDVRAPSDARPYFHQFLRADRLDEVRAAVGEGTLAFVEMGSILVALTGFALAAAAFILIVVPLLQLGWVPGGRAAVLFYFAAIGLGFMFLEILWIQRFTLFWGHPLYSAAGVIAAMLCGMGVGSACSGRLDAAPRSLMWVFAGIIMLSLGALFLTPPLFAAMLAWPQTVKWIAGFTLLSLPAFFLGMPFPLALRMLHRTRPQQVPWAWGINGCFSVIAAPLAVFLVMQGGFPALGWAAITVYGLAALAAHHIGGHAGATQTKPICLP